MSSQNKGMDRRTFLKATGITGASMAVTSEFASNIQAAENANSSAQKKIPARVLGNTGIPVPILSLGGTVDWTINQNLLRMALGMGVTLWHTADTYENGKSEIGIGQYFEKYPEDRKKVFLSTMHIEKHEFKQMDEGINVSLERMKTDYIDLYLFHCTDKPELFTPELKAWVDNKKKEGKIKHFGFGTHTQDGKILKYVSTLGWVEAAMLTYNFQLRIKDDVKEAVDTCSKAGMGLIAIKTHGLPIEKTDSPEELDALKYFMEKGYTLDQAKLKAVWNDERITTICSKIPNLTILKDNVSTACDSTKLSSVDFKVLDRLAENTCSSYCQGCGRCSLAMGSDENRISDILRYMMYYNSYGDRDQARELFRKLPQKVKNNLASKDYSIAESVCPHKIQIGKMMRKASILLA
jgi:uncharacterized protein